MENSTLFFNSFNPSLIQFFLEIFNGLPYDIRLDLHYLYLPQSKVRILAKFILYILPSNLSKSPYNYSENKLWHFYQVENSLWSDAFTIDTIGDTGKITCKLDSRRGSLKRNFQKSDTKIDDSYQVGIQISQSSSCFTKIVTFTPYYMIYNAASFDVILKAELKRRFFEDLRGSAALHCIHEFVICFGVNNTPNQSWRWVANQLRLGCLILDQGLV